MKKSELKEMIKMAMLEDARTDAEQEGYKDGFDDAKEDIEDKLKDMKVSEQEDVDVDDDVNVDVKDEENVDVDVEKDIDVDDVSKESDIEVKSELPGESSDVSAVLGLLTKAQEKAEGMGDEKLMDQIGNTITYYTRTHVVKGSEMMEEEMDKDVKEGDKEDVKEVVNEEVARFKKLAGLI
jgi:hypothetical protein|tara:strand:- start:104 stop:646 length:543 start_codon:yes stop_codon:yes gene_type:complete